MKTPRAYALYAPDAPDTRAGYVHADCADIHPLAVIQDDGETLDVHGNDLVPARIRRGDPAFDCCLACGDGIDR